MGNFDEMMTAALKALEQENYSDAQSFFESGLDINYATKCDQWTLLHKLLVPVVKPPDVHAVDYLIRLGADVNLEDAFGMTPLHYAARVKSIEIVRLLILAGAELNVCNKEGLTPLHQSAMKIPLDMQLIALFLKSGADPFVSCGSRIFMNFVRRIGGKDAEQIEDMVKLYASV